MGLHVSCLDNNRMATIQDSGIDKTYSDGEMTEFLANASFLFPEEKKIKKESNLRKMVKLEIPKPQMLSTISSPKYEVYTTSTPSPEKNDERKGLSRQSRIFSSNVSLQSVNIIEKIGQSQSLCSTNVNSRTNSRCVSPLMRIRTTIIE
ncbi:hypothetical protein SteCoe_2820 [Stentor coeruleus]|uniref:Uncharacterized protein n=1 Tax=Stentor coeruleus TaxID=5963 RepID=A0A1R2CYJ0_9CILI|nr:hypothetical protein SteCoe_2820 [Stentor coeruleus]